MKKAILLFAMLCLVLALTGCSCKHAETELRNVSQADCVNDGYTGDIYCLKCNAVVSRGEVISAKGHQLSETMNARQATCYSEGYTGDAYCTFCGTKVVQGEAIQMLEHTPGELERVSEAKCEREGYTGNIYCKVCGTLLEEGEAIPALEHVPGERVNVAEATCTERGYTGDVYCTICNSCIEYGERIDRIAHTPGEPQNVREATCTEKGYTGDIYCTVCNSHITGGEYTDKIDHTPGEPANAVEPTCLLEGFTGDTECIYCGKKFSGEAIAKLEHSFEDHTCTVCGWMEAGLYIDGKMEFSWEEMIANSYVTVDANNRLKSVVKSLYGLLVVEEGVRITDNYMFQESQLNGVYLPTSVSYIPYATFEDSAALEEVRCFGTMTKIDAYGFYGCSSLKEFIVPDGVTEINTGAFKYCTALQNIVLPDTLEIISEKAFEGCSALTEVKLPTSLEKIYNYAFRDCTALTSLELPEGLTYFGDDFILGTGVTELIAPSTITSFGSQQATALVHMDLSASQIKKINNRCFAYNANLKSVELPATLQELSIEAFRECPMLERLAFPEGFTGFNGSYDLASNTALTTIVWPASLTDGSKLASLPNLTEILYRGSELQWNLTASEDAFPNATIVFNYTGE